MRRSDTGALTAVLAARGLLEAAVAERGGLVCLSLPGAEKGLHRRALDVP